MLCSCTNPIFGKMLVSEIWAKIFSVNQIAEFFNEGVINFGWAWSKMGVARQVTGLWNWLYFKNELTDWTDFLHADANSGKFNEFNEFKINFNDSWMDVVINGQGHLFHETLKFGVCVCELSWFLEADCDVMIFGKSNIVLCIFDF